MNAPFVTQILFSADKSVRAVQSFPDWCRTRQTDTCSQSYGQITETRPNPRSMRYFRPIRQLFCISILYDFSVHYLVVEEEILAK